MKTIITTIFAMFVTVGFGASSQTATAPTGTDNFAIGYGAGYQSSGANKNVICIGTDAGMSSANNTNCIFIGAEAGKNIVGSVGGVIIGDVIFHTNGVTSIKGFSGNDFVKYGIDHSGINTSITIGSRGEGNVGSYSVVDGRISLASGDYSHAEGEVSTASGDCSHAEGYTTTASGYSSHSEGFNSTASGDYSHAEGGYNTASGSESHAEGYGCVAYGTDSHAEGYHTRVDSTYSHVEGSYTKSHSLAEASFVAGWGSNATSETAYVWQGVSELKTPHEEPSFSEQYYDHGKSSYNINPRGGISGFWIGETNMVNHIKNVIGATFALENGQFCVYINGIKAGTLTFTPVP